MGATNRLNQLSKYLVVPAAVLAGSMLSGCEKPQAAMTMPPPEVTTVAVAPQAVALSVELPGRTSPFRMAEIRPQVSGLLQKRLFTEGADVKAGQELYQIDPAPFQAALDNALAAVGKAQANLPAVKVRADRYKQALADKAVSQQDYDDAAAALNQAQAEIKYWDAMVETARINLAYTRMISPIAGRIGKSAITDGAIVTAYQPAALTSIQQLDPIYVDVPQSTTQMLNLRRRLANKSLNQDPATINKVELLLEDGSKYPLEGTLQFRDVTVDPTTGSVILRMIFPNPNSELLPGMFVRAVIKEGVNSQAILIPQQSVSRDPKGTPLAMIVNDAKKVEPRVLTLDRAIGDQWLVNGGLATGERVIVEGLLRVRPGMQVREVPQAAAQKPAAPATNAASAK